MSAKDIEMMKSLGIIPPEDDLDRQIEQVKNDKAYISNELVEAIYHSPNTITAFKILFYIARIDTTHNKKLGAYHHIKVNIREIEKYTGLTQKTIDRNIKDIQRTLVTFYDKKNKEHFSRTPLISKIEYLEDDRHMIVDMHEDIHYRINSNINFTPIDTLNIMKIDHKHSPKMIMLLTQISRYDEDKRQKSYTLAQLNYMFDVNYESLYMFEKKILLPVKKELDNNSSVSFEYIKVKDKTYTGKGRKPISHIKLKPVIKQYVETTLDDMINAQDEYNRKQQLKEDPKQILTEYIEQVSFKQPQLQQYLFERLQDYLEFIERENFTPKGNDWIKSFDKHCDGYKKNFKKLDERI